MAKFVIINGDITKCEVDAIVNAVGGGMDKAVHEAAGELLDKECGSFSCTDTGKVFITKGYDLSANHIIHTVPPVWNNGGSNEDELLASCYQNVLSLASDRGIKTLAFPSLGTGKFGFPVNRAARIAVNEISKFLESEDVLQKVFIVCYKSETFESYIKARIEICSEDQDNLI